MTISGAAAFSVAVVAAAGDGCRVEPTGQIFGDGSVCTAGQPAKQLDARLRQGALRPGTDAAAEDNIHMVLHQKACKGSVSLPVGGDDFGILQQAIFGGVDFELFRAAEVLEYLTVFIRNCDLHTKNSFLCTRFSLPILTDCGEIGKGTRAFCAFWGEKHSRYVKMISETAAKCIIIEPEKRVQV